MLTADFFGFFASFDAQQWFASIHDSASQLIGWALTKYDKAPALVLGIAIALALPVLATAGALIRLLSPNRKHAQPAEPSTVRTKPASAWRQHARLELPGNQASGYTIGQEIVRIGRETDNDLCLSDPTVHRYHAVLERTPEAEFILSYVGDPGHDGLIVNGQPTQRQRLRGGEVLEFGAIKLRFALSAA